MKARRAGLAFIHRRARRRAADEAEYGEVLASLRHYSNLRYAILGVFIAITGFLIAALYGKEPLQAPPQVGYAIRMFGLIAALAFGWIEVTLNGYLTAFGKAALRLRPDSHWALRPRHLNKGVPAAAILIHVAAAVFWLVSFWLPAIPAPA